MLRIGLHLRTDLNTKSFKCLVQLFLAPVHNIAVLIFVTQVTDYLEFVAFDSVTGMLFTAVLVF